LQAIEYYCRATLHAERSAADYQLLECFEPCEKKIQCFWPRAEQYCARKLLKITTQSTPSLALLMISCLECFVPCEYNVHDAAYCVSMLSFVFKPPVISERY
jgi:hypothetical protein